MKNNSVKPVPDGYHTLTTFLMVNDGESAMEFMKIAFNATALSVHKSPDGKLMHAEMQVGDSRLMLGEGNEKYPAMPAMLYMYVEDCDAVYNKAIKAGGTSLREPTNEFYGDRSCGVRDSSGNQWWIATHIEDVTPEEMKRREEAFIKGQETRQA
jgi:PhnB protein